MNEPMSHALMPGQPLDAALLFGAGLGISLGHCLGMCGPLVGAIAAQQRQRGLSLGALVTAQVIHHAGRITSYAIIGFVLAALGSAVQATKYGDVLRGALSLTVGMVMILIGLGLLGLLPGQTLGRAAIGSGRFTLAISRATAGLRRVGGPGGSYFMGIANGFLPCGPVYAVAAGTVVASPLAGAGAMVLFGLGTVPALLIFAVSAGGLSPAIQRGFGRLGGILVTMIGLQLLCRGAAALGWIEHLKLGSVVLW